MQHLSITAISLSLVIGLQSTAVAGVCLSDLMDSNGLHISSPFGVDRTGNPSASPGYHQGIDLNNSQGAGAQVRAGFNGTVVYHHFGGGGVAADVSNGNMKFRYLHMAHHYSGTKSVTTGQELGRVGCAGMKVCSPHLHLYAMMLGSALATSGYNYRAFREGSSKLAAPMTGDAIKSAAPTTYYYVNPEPYLPQQVPITKPYNDMPGGRRTTSLPTTCTPDTSSPVSPHSEGASASVDSALEGQASLQAGEDFGTKAADEANRSLYLDIARQTATEQSVYQREIENLGGQDATIAQILLIQADQGAVK